MKNKLVIANWKMNGNLTANATLLNAIVDFSESAENTDIVVCPPAIYIAQAEQLLSASKVKTGAQNVCTETSGAFTGETSVEMLKDFNCQYGLVGHSERRSLYNETDADIAQKIIKMVEAKITPVFCIGESLEQRESNETKAVIISQIKSIIDIVGLETFKEVVIAYEPIWAIGTGKTASAQQAQEIHQQIRIYLEEIDSMMFANTAILYGGSVNEKNADELIQQPDINGFLVGGASLKADAFQKICTAQ